MCLSLYIDIPLHIYMDIYTYIPFSTYISLYICTSLSPHIYKKRFTIRSWLIQLWRLRSLRSAVCRSENRRSPPSSTSCAVQACNTGQGPRTSGGQRCTQPASSEAHLFLKRPHQPEARGSGWRPHRLRHLGEAGANSLKGLWPRFSKDECRKSLHCENAGEQKPMTFLV